MYNNIRTYIAYSNGNIAEKRCSCNSVPSHLAIHCKLGTMKICLDHYFFSTRFLGLANANWRFFLFQIIFIVIIWNDHGLDKKYWIYRKEIMKSVMNLCTFCCRSQKPYFISFFFGWLVLWSYGLICFTRPL